MDCSTMNMQLSIFGNFESLDSSSDVITQLYDQFKGDGFLPSTIQVLQVEQPSNKAIVRLRPQLLKVDDGYIINILPDRIDLIINAIDGNNPDLHYEMYIDIIKRIMNVFSLVSNRLAFTATYQLNATQVQSLNLKKQLVPAISYYEKNLSIDARAHNVARPLIKISDEISEYCNVNSDVIFETNIQGEAPQIRTLIRFDINTLPEQSRARFYKDNVENFYRVAYEIKEQIIKDLVTICE